MRASLKLRPLQRPQAGRHASWVELFFDVVFVVAVSQIAHALEKPDAAHLVAFVVTFAAAWWTWLGYTFYADFFESNDWLYRAAMFAGMFAVMGLAVNAPLVIGAGGAGFALSFVVARAVLLLLYVRAYLAVPVARPFAGRFLAGFGPGGALWLASVFAPPDTRLALWLAAFALEVLTLALSQREVRAIPFDGEHIPERLGLFTVLVLGEAVLSIARGLGTAPGSFDLTLVALGGFAVVALVWWLYFERTAVGGVTSAFTARFQTVLYAHLPLSLGVVAAGVGLESILWVSEGGAHGDAAGEGGGHGAPWLLPAGVALSLLTLAVMRAAGRGEWAGPARVAAALVLAALAGMSPAPGTALVAVLAVLGGLAALEAWRARLDRAAGRAGAGPEYAALDANLTLEGGGAETPGFGACAHTADVTVTATDERVCPDCVREGTRWVELRLCLVCGHVGCCDSSPRRHATRHFHATGHPVMRSIEPDDRWAWCYVDQRFVDVPESHEVPPRG